MSALPAVQAACPCCGDVALTPRQIRMDLPIHGGDWTYTFRCPLCSEEITRPVTDHVLAGLVSAGVHAEFGLDGPADARSSHFG